MSNPAYGALPNPSAAQPLRHPDQRFLDSEAFTNKFASHLSGPMEKVTRRTMKRWSGTSNEAVRGHLRTLISSIELSADHADLGGILNGFSLSESGALAASVEKTGQAIDTTYMSTTRLVCRLWPSDVRALTINVAHRLKTLSKHGRSLSTSMPNSQVSSRSYWSIAIKSMSSTR